MPPADMPLQVDADGPPPGAVRLPQVAPARRRWSRGLALPLLVVLLLAAGVVGAYVFRDRIVKRWPQSAQIYELVGLPHRAGDGLELDNINYSHRHDGSDDVLQVQGEVFNPTESEVALPPLKASLRDDGGKLLYDWTFDIERATIRPGEIIPFRTEARNPPPAATKLAVGFSTGR
jgi:hypothetical protein